MEFSLQGGGDARTTGHRSCGVRIIRCVSRRLASWPRRFFGESSQHAVRSSCCPPVAGLALRMIPLPDGSTDRSMRPAVRAPVFRRSDRETDTVSIPIVRPARSSFALSASSTASYRHASAAGRKGTGFALNKADHHRFCHCSFRCSANAPLIQFDGRVLGTHTVATAFSLADYGG